MKQYHDFLHHIRDNGRFKGDRTGTGTISVFGYQMRFNLQDGFPLVTTKKLHLKSIIHELLWFLRGETNIAYLKEHDVKIWDEWATEDGELGPIYGFQWRNWSHANHIDQIAEAVKLLRTKPDSRRNLVSAWNPADLPDESISPQANVELGRMALAACHAFFQFYSVEATLSERLAEARRRGVGDFSQRANDERGWTTKSWFGDATAIHEYVDSLDIPRRILSCQLYQRSADAFLGVPFNIASYALFTHMMAQVTGHMVGDFVHTFGDAHIYSNHREQIVEQLSRKPYPLPQLRLNPAVKEIDDFKFEDIEIIGYESHPPIKGKVAV